MHRRQHHREAVAPQGVLEQASEFGVSVGDVGQSRAGVQGHHYLAQRRERRVDVEGLCLPLAFRRTLLQPLAPGEVNEVEHA